MRSNRKRISQLMLTLGLMAAFVMSASADAVSDWAILAYTSSSANMPARPVPAQPRIAAMTQIAIHDALNAIDHRYEQYAFVGSDADAAAIAAIAAAGYNVLRFENPTTELTTQLALYNAQLALVPDGPAKDAGIALGTAAAAAIRAARSNDGILTAQCPYTAGTAPGEWRPLPGQTFTLPCLGDVTPFTMRSGDQWRVPTRPYFTLTSKTYALEFEEVRIVGKDNNECTTPGQTGCRSEDQSDAAIFWAAVPIPQTWTRAAASVATQHNLDLWESGRLFALLSVAEADAAIAVWDSKRALPFWRPIAAIREADTDDNPSTQVDPTWTSLLGTPPYPDYNSGHSGLDGAAADVLRRFFETDDASFTLTQLGIVRSFTSFREASVEAANSRIWGGIHFRSACEDALMMGNNIGRQAFNHYFRPLKDQFASGPFEADRFVVGSK
jgi:hypothetical protein